MDMHSSLDLMLEYRIASNGKIGLKFPLEKLKVGQSFKMPKKHRASLSNHIRIEYMDRDEKFITRSIKDDNENIIVRRIA